MDKKTGIKLISSLMLTASAGIIIGLIPLLILLTPRNASETSNESCTIITSDHMYENCVIIEHYKENGFIEFKCDGKDICVHGQYTIIKESE